MFIDSIFRSYPVPALFLHENKSPGLDETPTKKWEIVDGQQRLTALRDFTAGRWPLLETKGDTKLRLPKTVLALPAAWAGLLYSQLTPNLREQFDSAQISAFIIGADAHPDEVRDLFIRLQSGTALTRQQIRDAWPGNLGPFVERLAGKLERRPTEKLFAIIDKRGQRSEDEESRDLHVGDRQTCAQLLKVFLTRERDAAAYPSVSANELDAMYHEHTDFDENSLSANRFKTVLSQTADVFAHVKDGLGNRKKFRRLDVAVVAMCLQDVTKSPNFKWDKTCARDLASNIVRAETGERPAAGKSTAGSTLKNYYTWWREKVCGDVGIRLDDRRFFDERQRIEIRQSWNRKCAVCGDDVADEEAEYDHYPVPHRDGGRTEVKMGASCTKDVTQGVAQHQTSGAPVGVTFTKKRTSSSVRRAVGGDTLRLRRLSRWGSERSRYTPSDTYRFQTTGNAWPWLLSPLAVRSTSTPGWSTAR